MLDEIQGCYAKMGESIRVAIRSSATAEDLTDASFAGQQETYLNVRGMEKVINRIKDCFASCFGYRAVAYRKENAVPQDTVRAAVVVQEMIEADTAGVMFTANVLNGKREETVINASYGLGEAVVSGMVTPDQYILNAEGKEISCYIGSKEVEIIYDVHETKECLVKPELRNQRALEQGMVRKLFYYPLDFEIAMILGETKEQLFKSFGLIVPSTFKMDDEGITTLVRSTMGINGAIVHLPKVFRQMKDIEANKMQGEKEFYECKSALKHIKNQPLEQFNEDLRQLVSQLKQNENFCSHIDLEKEALKEHFSKEWQLIEAFLSKHGDRSEFNGYPFSAASWNEEPERLIHLLKQMIKMPPKEKKETITYLELLNKIKEVAGKKADQVEAHIEAVNFKVWRRSHCSIHSS